jgi:hypothetical protein
MEPKQTRIQPYQIKVRPDKIEIPPHTIRIPESGYLCGIQKAKTEKETDEEGYHHCQILIIE